MPESRSLAALIASQVYRRNRARLRKRLGKRRASPWMRPYEEDLIRELLTALQPKRCLEWGGGLSTVQFPALLAKNATWLTIEHDDGWAAHLATMVARPGVAVRHVPPDVAHPVGDGDATSFASYLTAADAGAPYDLIFIDGRARAACVDRARRLIAPDGVVILHDANRDIYLAPTAHYAKQELLRDHRVGRPRVAGGVWLGSPEREIGSLLNLALHRRAWAFYSGIGRLLA